MKKRYIRSMCTAAVSCCMMLPPFALAAEDMKPGGSVTVGIQNLNLNGDKESKFEEYQDGLREDITLEQLQLQGEKDDMHFNVEARDISQKDQSFTAEGGQYGKYKLQFKWDEIIKNYYNGAKFLGTETSPGTWSVPNSTQSTLETNFTALNTEPTAGEKAVLQGFLDAAPTVDLKVEREKGEVNLLYSLYKNFNIRAGFSHESKEGYRALGTGSYLRAGAGATAIGGLGENFRLYGLELPESIDYVTDVFSAGFDYRRDNWHVDLTYRYTNFSNKIGELTWDNPLLLTGQDNLPGGSPLNRLDLSPDSNSHNLTLTGGMSDLPLNSKVTATLSRDLITQDDRFLPYTVNTAVLDDAGAVAANLALPANDLDGDVTTTLFNLLLNSKPTDQLAVNLKYNYYDYKNDSRKITWDGFVGVGETTWYDWDGTAGGLGVFKGNPYTNRVPEYTRTRGGAEASYKINRMFTVKGDYNYEGYDRNEDRNADTKEDIFGGSVQVKPSDWAMLRLGYHYADRDLDSAYTSHIGTADEWDELRMFDQSERKRDIYDAYLSLEPMDRLSLGFSLNYKDDDYDTNYYGLQEGKGYMAGVDATYMLSDSVSISAYYSRDDYETKQKNRTKTDATNTAALDFTIEENDFNTKLDDTTDTVGMNVVVKLIPDTLTMSLGADYSKAKGKIDTTNPDFLAGTTTSGATAYAWPELKTETTELKANLNYQMTPQLLAGLHYLYRRFQMDDFATDNLQAYGNATDTQGNSLSHYIFMDANYSDYEAHLVAATLKYSF